MDARSYSPKPITSKRKCSSCGKVKRVSKCRKTQSTNGCPCAAKKDVSVADKPFPDVDPSPSPASRRPTSAIGRSATSPAAENDRDFGKSPSYACAGDLPGTGGANRKMGKLFRSKVYDFHTLKDAQPLADALPNPPKANPAAGATSVNVIVPTTRKIFAPLARDENGGTSAVVSYTIDESEDAKAAAGRPPAANAADAPPPTPAALLELETRVDTLPPASPLAAKRNFAKDNNSSIRLMIAHYNRLMSETAAERSEAAGGGCSWTPTLQKSPVLERRNHFEQQSMRCGAGESNAIRKSKSAVLSTAKITAAAAPAPRADPRRDGATPDGDDENSPRYAIAKCSSAGSLQCRGESFGRCLKEAANTAPPLPDSGGAERRPSAGDRTSDQPPPPCVAMTAADVGAIDDDGDDHSKSSNAPTPDPAPPLERNSSFESVLSEAKLRNLRLQAAKKKFFDEHPSTVVAGDRVKGGGGGCDDDDAGDKTPPLVQWMRALTPQQPPPTPQKSRRAFRPPPAEREKSSSLAVVQPHFGGAALNKSVSTGAIDDRARSAAGGQRGGEARGGGAATTSAGEKTPKSKFGLSSIASKFRRVRMRRHAKEPEQGAVSVLCRASLFMNVDKEQAKSKDYLSASKSCPSSPVTQRSMSKRNSSSN